MSEIKERSHTQKLIRTYLFIGFHRKREETYAIVNFLLGNVCKTYHHTIDRLIHSELDTDCIDVARTIIDTARGEGIKLHTLKDMLAQEAHKHM